MFYWNFRRFRSYKLLYSEGLTSAPQYGVRGWTRSQIDQFKKAGYIMNGYLGEEGQFGYLAGSAGGVRKAAKKIKGTEISFFHNFRSIKSSKRKY